MKKSILSTAASVSAFFCRVALIFGVVWFGATFASSDLSVLTSIFAAEGDLLDVRDAADRPIELIFDADVGSDIDDAFALAIVHRFCDRGVCELLGVTLTNPSRDAVPNSDAARFVAAINALNGRPDVPVGIPANARPVADTYPARTLAQTLPDGSAEYPVPENFAPEDAVRLLRRLLASAEDGEVVVVQVGKSTNLAALLDSPADDLSPLTGRELAERKVRLVSAMAGGFSFDESTKKYAEHREWNVICDVPAARKVFEEWPGEIVFSGYETGDLIRMSPTNLKNDYRSRRAKVLRDAFEHWANRNAPNEGLNHRRPTWDLTSVLFVVRPEDGRGYFALSAPGNVDVADDGQTIFSASPDGKRRVFVLDEAARIRVGEAIVDICSEP